MSHCKRQQSSHHCLQVALRDFVSNAEFAAHRRTKRHMSAIEVEELLVNVSRALWSIGTAKANSTQCIV